jgi:hypothetical protein
MRNGLTGFVSILLLLLLMVSCIKEDCCDLEESEDDSITGTWVLYERGYSPGSGYTVEAVEPGQKIALRSKRRMTSNIQELSDFHFYVVQNDVIGFFKEDPGPSPDEDEFKHSYNIVFDGDTVKLNFRYCFEGCHLGFRRK